MYDRLVVHAHVPRSGSGQLNRAVFLPGYAVGETMLAYGGRHGQSARFPAADQAEVATRLGRTQMAMGHVPYGYFDGLGRWAIYISVFDDPVRRFLRFAGSIMAHRRKTAATLFGREACADHVGDPERTVENLLSLEDVQKRQTDVMTRIAAGLPAFGDVAPRRGHLCVARANMARSNYLVAVRDQMEEFEVYLSEVLGVAADGRRDLGWSDDMRVCRPTGTVEIARSDLSARVLRRIEAANDLDMRLYDSVARRNAVCWA